MRTHLCRALLATLVALATLALVGGPARAADPVFVDEVSRYFEYETGFGSLPECGPRNINGRGPSSLGNRARWEVSSTLADGATVQVGDEWTVRGDVSGLTANDGNNGPDPLFLRLPLQGPVAAISPAQGVWEPGPGEVVSGGDGFVGEVAQYGDFGFEFDANSNPGAFELGDGVGAQITLTVRATAPGVITLGHMDVDGYDGTPIAGNFACDFQVGFSWTVEAPDVPPTSGPDNATTDASYSLLGPGGTVDDENGGAHAIDIDVLSNDDDPNVPGGPGDLDEVRVADWSQSTKGGTVSCGTPDEQNAPAFGDLSDGPCRYTPPQDEVGNDKFSYLLRSVSGLTRLVTVNVFLRANPAPVAPPAGFATTDEAVDVKFDLADVAGDVAGDTDFECVPDFAVILTPDVGDATLDADCILTFTAADTNTQKSGELTYRVCDVHPLLTEFGAQAVAVAGYDQGIPDDRSATTSSRCRDASATITVYPVTDTLIIPVVGHTDVDIVDTSYPGEYGTFGLDIPVFDNDTDPNGPDPADLSSGVVIPPGTNGIQSLTPADAGTATRSTDGRSVLFTPAPGYEGPVTFDYVACEDPEQQNPPYPHEDDPDTFQLEGLPVCGVGSVALQVVGNEAPITEPDAVLTSTIAEVVGLDVGVNHNDPDGDPLLCTPGSLSATPEDLVESASITADCLVDLTPVLGAEGVAEVAYEVCDEHGLAGATYPTSPYGTDGTDVGGTVSRCSQGVLAATIVAPAQDDPGLFELDPAPTCAADAATTAPGTAVEVPVLTNDTDVDFEGQPSPLTVVNAGIPDLEGVTDNDGAVAPTADAARVRYTPPAGFTGTDTFFYSTQDAVGKGCSAEVTVTVSAAPATAAPPETTGAPGAADPGGAGGALPRTGNESGVLLRLAIALVVLGAGFLSVGGTLRPRRRRYRLTPAQTSWWSG